MEDVVAVEVVSADGVRHHIVTFGRIQDAVDPGPLEALVREHAGKFGLGDAVSVRVCGSLQEARHAPYFFEALIDVGSKLSDRRFGDGYATWRSQMDEEMHGGRQLHYLGDPNAPWFVDGPGSTTDG
jgi:hypothetical protein